MNKTELIDSVAAQAGLSKVDAKKAVDAFMKATQDTLVKGDKLTLVGFGTFYTVDRPAHEGRNPQTKKKIMIPAKKVAKFKVGATLAGAVK